MYQMHKSLTDILNPLDEKAESLKNSKQLKEELEIFEIDNTHIMGSLDIRQMYPMIPVEKPLKITEEQIIQDNTLWGRAEWKPGHIFELLEVCLETNFQTYKGIVLLKLMELPLGSQFQDPQQEFLQLGLKTYLLRKDNSKHELFYGGE